MAAACLDTTKVMTKPRLSEVEGDANWPKSSRPFHNLGTSSDPLEDKFDRLLEQLGHDGESMLLVGILYGWMWLYGWGSWTWNGRAVGNIFLVVCAGGCGSFVMSSIILATIHSTIDEYVALWPMARVRSWSEQPSAQCVTLGFRF
ncbi:hypothetical protein V8C26DRAFT_221034 [Trichoderma gracile]